jgi:hypothetical protein
MRSAKYVPTSTARLLAKKFGASTTPGMLTSKGQRRWNGSKAGSLEGGLAKGKERRWTSLSVLSLMIATGVGATAFARYQAEGKRVKQKWYSNPDKWNQPKYASIKDMEAVSDPYLDPKFTLLDSGTLWEGKQGNLKRHSIIRVG